MAEDMNTKVCGVTVKAIMLVEFTHWSSWSPKETIESLHHRAVNEMRTAIANDRQMGARLQVLDIKKVVTVSHEEDRA